MVSYKIHCTFSSILFSLQVFPIFCSILIFGIQFHDALYDLDFFLFAKACFIANNMLMMVPCIDGEKSPFCTCRMKGSVDINCINLLYCFKKSWFSVCTAVKKSTGMCAFHISVYESSPSFTACFMYPVTHVKDLH